MSSFFFDTLPRLKKQNRPLCILGTVVTGYLLGVGAVVEACTGSRWVCEAGSRDSASGRYRLL